MRQSMSKLPPIRQTVDNASLGGAGIDYGTTVVQEVGGRELGEVDSIGNNMSVDQQLHQAAHQTTTSSSTSSQQCLVRETPSSPSKSCSPHKSKSSGAEAFRKIQRALQKHESREKEIVKHMRRQVGVVGQHQRGRGGEDATSREQRLAEKYNLPKIEAEARIDTNRYGGGEKKKKLVPGLKPGDLEQELVKRVIKGDYDWVYNALQKAGRDLLFSEWGGGITKTCILYAANKADLEMCKLLLRYGGKELLAVKDLKNRDVAHYAAKHGFDIGSLKGMGQGLVDCWNYRVLMRQPAQQGKQGASNGGGGSSSSASCSTSGGPAAADPLSGGMSTMSMTSDFSTLSSVAGVPPAAGGGRTPGVGNAVAHSTRTAGGGGNSSLMYATGTPSPLKHSASTHSLASATMSNFGSPAKSMNGRDDDEEESSVLEQYGRRKKPRRSNPNYDHHLSGYVKLPTLAASPGKNKGKNK